MKKIATLMCAALALLMSACAPTPEDVAKKISEGSELSQTDYRVMLESSRQAISQALDTLNKYADIDGSRRQLMDALLILQDQEYPYQTLFTQQLDRIDPATLDDENKKLYEGAIKDKDLFVARISEVLNVIPIQMNNGGVPQPVKPAAADSVAKAPVDGASDGVAEPTVENKPEVRVLEPNK